MFLNASMKFKFHRKKNNNTKDFLNRSVNC